ncbi:unnamed protein product [Tetraodon nigroviridis]|uniref:(spotted green pufferfish) hypothetical protein n=1 Tax=Tetraodon nigroviridis TaxID=99883 RepID=Q4RPW2_TETNG|nr:unnamed protein product [Tetraodon nigroviridis]
MLCFIVHGSSGSTGLEDDSDHHLEAGVDGGGCHHNSLSGIGVPGIGIGIGATAVSKLAERYATLASPEDCSKFPLSPRELAVWEGPGRSLLSAVPAKLIAPPVLFRKAGVSVTVPIPVPVPGYTSDYTEMVRTDILQLKMQHWSPCLHPLFTLFEANTLPSVSSPPGCRCVRGSVPRYRGAPLLSSLAAPLPPPTVGWRTEQWVKVWERPPPTLKPATATFPSVRFPPLQRLLPLPPPPRRPPPPPRPLMAAMGRTSRGFAITVQAHPPAACVTPATTAALKVPTWIT